MMAGFEEAIFIIKKKMGRISRALIDERAGKHMKVKYAFQELSDLPQGYGVPEGRGEAVGHLSCGA